MNNNVYLKKENPEKFQLIFQLVKVALNYITNNQKIQEEIVINSNSLGELQDWNLEPKKKRKKNQGTNNTIWIALEPRLFWNQVNKKRFLKGYEKELSLAIARDKRVQSNSR